MAAVTLQELIAQREQINEKKKQLHEIETSVGTFVVKRPDAAIIADMQNLRNPVDMNAFLIYNCVVDPNLRNAELQKAYGTFEGLDIVKKIFPPGEIIRIADALLELAGYGGKLKTRVHEVVKN